MKCNPEDSHKETSYRFNGKEYDKETGNYYYGARYYDPKLSIWLSVDPWANKYSHITPYNFVENNPIYLVDPTGLGPEVVITGADADKATQELNKSTSLEITRDANTGKLSATGDAKTAADKKLLEAINDKDVTVNLETTNSNSYVAKDDGNTYDLAIGAYEGSTVSTDAQGNNKVNTHQKINMGHTSTEEAAGGNPASLSVLHETLESYIGGKDDPGGNWNTGYHNAHQKANALDPRLIPGNNGVNQNTQTGKTEAGMYVGGKFIKLYEK